MSHHHPCKDKCSDFKGEQCKNCLIHESPVTAVNFIEVLCTGEFQALFDQVFKPQESNVQM